MHNSIKYESFIIIIQYAIWCNSAKSNNYTISTITSKTKIKTEIIELNKFLNDVMILHLSRNNCT